MCAQSGEQQFTQVGPDYVTKCVPPFPALLLGWHLLGMGAGGSACKEAG